MPGQDFKWSFFRGHRRFPGQPQSPNDGEAEGGHAGGPWASSAFRASSSTAFSSVDAEVRAGRHIFSPSHCWPHQQRPWMSIRQVPVPQHRGSCMVFWNLCGWEWCRHYPSGQFLASSRVTKEGRVQGFPGGQAVRRWPARSAPGGRRRWRRSHSAIVSGRFRR
jgi:hypothetical protein